MAGAAPASGKGGPLRSLAWAGAAMWWAAKSPTGVAALGAAALPWLLCSVLTAPTMGLSLLLAVALNAQLCVWSALCAGAHFKGGAFSSASARAAWVALLPSMRGLSMAFMACALAALAWSQLCVDLTGIAPMLEAIKQAKGGPEARQAFEEAWAKEGMDGVALPLALLELGLGAVNALWCLLPWRAIDKPGSTARELLGFGLGSVGSSPWALWGLGTMGALFAQLAMFLPPAALLSGVWFTACAFAYRDLGSSARP